MNKLRNKLKLDTEISRTTQARSAAALIALLAMLLPWVWLDGDNSSMSAAELLAYGFTNPERGSMIRVSLPGTIALLFIPPVVILVAIMAFIKTAQGRYPLMLNATAAALPLVLILFAKPVISSDDHSLAGIPVSHAGAIIAGVCHASLLVHGILQQNGYLDPETPEDEG